MARLMPPVSGGLGKGVTGGEWNLPCIYSLPWSPTYLNPANLTASTHCLSLFTFQFPSLSTFQISEPPAVLLLPACRSNMFLRAVNILGLQQLNGTRGLSSLAMMSLRTSSEAVKNTAVTQGV